MAAWAVCQYWNECGQWDRRNWFKDKCLPSPFFPKIKNLKDGKLSPNKKNRSPTKSPWTLEKNMKKHLCTLWYFWAIFGRDFPGDSRYSTIHLLQRKVPQPDSCNFRWVDDLAPFTKMYQQMCGTWQGEKKTLKQKRVEVFGCCKSIFFWGNMFGGEGHKTLLKKWWKHVPDLGKLTYPTGGKRKSSWEVPTR